MLQPLSVFLRLTVRFFNAYNSNGSSNLRFAFDPSCLVWQHKNSYSCVADPAWSGLVH